MEQRIEKLETLCELLTQNVLDFNKNLFMVNNSLIKEFQSLRSTYLNQGKNLQEIKTLMGEVFNQQSRSINANQMPTHSYVPTNFQAQPDYLAQYPISIQQPTVFMQQPVVAVHQKPTYQMNSNPSRLSSQPSVVTNEHANNDEISDFIECQQPNAKKMQPQIQVSPISVTSNSTNSKRRSFANTTTTTTAATPTAKPPVIPVFSFEPTKAPLFTFGSANSADKTSIFSFGSTNQVSSPPSTSKKLTQSKVTPTLDRNNLFSGLPIPTFGQVKQNEPTTSNLTFTQKNAPANESTLNKTILNSNGSKEPVVESTTQNPVQTLDINENEEIIFSERCKLFRFDRATNEWNEKGVGNMQIVKHKSYDNMRRLLMKADATGKLCANHRITYDLKYELFQEKQVRWHAQDYSFGSDSKKDHLAARFRSSQEANLFLHECNKALEAIEKFPYV